MVSQDLGNIKRERYYLVNIKPWIIWRWGGGGKDWWISGRTEFSSTELLWEINLRIWWWELFGVCFSWHIALSHSLASYMFNGPGWQVDMRVYEKHPTPIVWLYANVLCAYLVKKNNKKQPKYPYLFDVVRKMCAGPEMLQTWDQSSTEVVNNSFLCLQ